MPSSSPLLAVAAMAIVAQARIRARLRVPGAPKSPAHPRTPPLEPFVPKPVHPELRRPQSSTPATIPATQAQTAATDRRSSCRSFERAIARFEWRPLRESRRPPVRSAAVFGRRSSSGAARQRGLTSGAPGSLTSGSPGAVDLVNVLTGQAQSLRGGSRLTR